MTALSAAETDRLLDAVRAGDDAALEALLEAVQPQVYRFGMRLCAHPEDAEDVLQETLLTLARRLREFRGDAALSTYVYAVARSHCIKKRRRRKDAPAELDGLDTVADAQVAEGSDQFRMLETQETWARVATAISQLEPAQKEVLVLRDVEGLSASEVAEVVEASVSAVKSRLHRARRSLREKLGILPPGADCPDIVEMFSRHHEGELAPDICTRMEAHLAGCPRCAKVCDELRADLVSCSNAPHAEVPPELQARIKRALGLLKA